MYNTLISAFKSCPNYETNHFKYRSKNAISPCGAIVMAKIVVSILESSANMHVECVYQYRYMYQMPAKFHSPIIIMRFEKYN